MLVVYLRGAYFAVLIYSSDVGDVDGRVDFVKVAIINPVWLIFTKYTFGLRSNVNNI